MNRSRWSVILSISRRNFRLYIQHLLKSHLQVMRKHLILRLNLCQFLVKNTDIYTAHLKKISRHYEDDSDCPIGNSVAMIFVTCFALMQCGRILSEESFLAWAAFNLRLDTSFERGRVMTELDGCPFRWFNFMCLVILKGLSNQQEL